MAGAMKFNLTCPRCGGSGKLRNACPTCDGDGRVTHTETRGGPHSAGRAQRLAPARPRQGQRRHHGRASGRSLHHHHASRRIRSSSRDGDNIEITVPVAVWEAALGAKIEVPTIDGRTLLKIPQGTKNGQKFRLREKGVLNSRTNQRGDQIVEVAIEAPEAHDERTRELLRELAQAASRGSARRNLGEGLTSWRRRNPKPRT